MPLVAAGAVADLIADLRRLYRRERALRLPENPRLAAIEAIARDLAEAEPDALAAPDDAPHDHPARVRMGAVLGRILALWEPWEEPELSEWLRVVETFMRRPPAPVIPAEHWAWKRGGG